MTQRDRDAFEDPLKNKLPIFEATRSKDFPGFLIVFCPRENCCGTRRDRPFLVHQNTWLSPKRVVSVKTGLPFVMVGRSCPYCFRPSRIPSRASLR